ncbi:MAG TPA: hypothetical protein VLS94_06505 [Fusibacter sp.]|nr:hypothetical protein [Fusibacter sp.]
MDRFLRKTYNFIKNISGTNFGNTTEIINLGNFDEFNFSGFRATRSIFLENLLLTYYLPSLSLTPFPDISITDSNTEKLTKIIEQEGNYDKVYLKVLLGKGSESYQVARPALMNRGRETQINLLNPYLSAYDVKLLESNDSLSVQLQWVSSNAVTNANYVIISGEYREEITLIEYRASNYISTVLNVSTEPVTYTGSTNRAYLMIQNTTPPQETEGVILVSFNGSSSQFAITPYGNLEMDISPINGPITLTSSDNTAMTVSILEGF